jgi:mono/diheme cytochrome c family protein
MFRLMRVFCISTVVGVTFAALGGGLLSLGWTAARADDSAAAEPAPPEGQTYTGAKACASCHFEQYMSWKKTKHAQAFDVLTAKYQSDSTCLKCHTTGLGEATGFKDMATTPALAGVTCETCHGPGSEHEKVVQAFGQKKLSPEEEKQAKDTIWLILPKNVCVECHKVIGHGKSLTPPELKGK